MKIIKWIILFLILCNMPSYMLAYFGSGLGSITSYASSLLLLVYFFFARPRHKLLLPFILLGILYFTISGIHFSYPDEKLIINEFLRFMILVVCAVEVIHRTNKKELFIVLFIGALSIIINALIFPEANANFYPTYGRYSGFYLNPNTAGITCLIGYVFTYGINDRRLKLAGQIVFTLAGIFTFSRTFIIIWLLITLIAIYNNRKNLLVPVIGALILILVFVFSGRLTLNTERFDAITSIFESKGANSDALTEDSRTETWAIYSDMIMDKPILGHGYLKLSNKQYGPGVHNSYLMILGESGFIPFLLFLGIYTYIVSKSIRLTKTNPEYLYISIVIVLALLASHTYFTEFFKVFISMFLFVEIRKLQPTLNIEKTE